MSWVLGVEVFCERALVGKWGQRSVFAAWVSWLPYSLQFSDSLLFVLHNQSCFTLWWQCFWRNGGMWKIGTFFSVCPAHHMVCVCEYVCSSCSWLGLGCMAWIRLRGCKLFRSHELLGTSVLHLFWLWLAQSWLYFHSQGVGRVCGFGYRKHWFYQEISNKEELARLWLSLEDCESNSYFVDASEVISGAFQLLLPCDDLSLCGVWKKTTFVGVLHRPFLFWSSRVIELISRAGVHSPFLV